MRKNTLQPSERKPPTSSNVIGGQMAGLYDLEETLGKGHFAIVKAARHVFTGERVAVKVIDKTKLDAISQKGLLKEVLCMKLVQHPNVVRLYEVIDTTTKMYLVLELGQGDLYDLILRNQGGLQEDVARKYFSQILAAVSYCHKLHVAHRDLKPENVVFFPQDGMVKLTDFGFSNRFCPGVKLDTSCGSLAYSAPEILLGDSYDAQAVDIWSLGVILYMLVCGRAPFQEANESETLTMIMDVKYTVPSHVSPLCTDLIRRMIVYHPDKRAMLEDIERDPWVNQDGYHYSQVQNTPLISHNRLTNEEKNSIIQQMVAGDITTREQILEALQSDAYNHVTSTFYLLAEKHLRERGVTDVDDNKPGTSSALTASLESLHDRRKNSDTEDLASGEDDSLAPLDLEISKNNNNAGSQSSKKTSRMHTVLSSSALSELDKSLPILEEDATVHSQEVEDRTGPLPQAVRRAHYSHRRVMVPQRSASSCSSSEDEDSEKKKRNLPPHRHKNKTAKGHSSAGEDTLGRRFRDDESSDEQTGGFTGGCGNSSAVLENSSSCSTTNNGGAPNDNGSGQGNSNNNNGNNGSSKSQSDSTNNGITNISNSTTRKETDIDDTNACNNSYYNLCQEQSVKHHIIVHHCQDDDDDDEEEEEPRQKIQHQQPQQSPEDEEQQQPLGDSRLNYIKTSLSFFDQENDISSQFSNLVVKKLPPSISTGNIDISDRHSCSDVAYAVKSVVSNTVSDPNPVRNNSVAKKGKRLFFSWFFLRRKKNINNSNNMPASSGIYKTRSCAELKLKNGVNRKQMDLNQNI